MTRYPVVSVAALFLACATTAQQSPGVQRRGADLLPELTSLQGLSPVGEPRQAVADELFELIDGGAELYLRHGFDRAVTQEYETADGTRYTLEIFAMQDRAGAEAVYGEKGGARSTGPSIGDAGTFEEYYGLYLLGRYHFTVTASRTQGDLRPMIERLARAVVLRLPTRANE